MRGPQSQTMNLIAAAALALPAGAALAQSYDPAYDQSQAQYNRDLETYRAQQQIYQDKRNTYDAQREAYEQDRANYERARAAYDARWGIGAYERRYGPFRGYYTDTYAYDPDAYSTTPYRGYYEGTTDYYAAYRNTPCEERRENNTAAGAVIGALAGAALGSNIAGHGVRTEGAVLGAVVGGVAGGSIGRSSAHCDSGGRYYFSYEQTYPYREADWDRNGRSGRYDYSWYTEHRCRLAVAPADWNGVTDYRYVRVCPDEDGNYRITD